MNTTKFMTGYRHIVGPLSQGQVDGLSYLLDGLVDWDVWQQAYILATVRHETAGTFQPIEERGSKVYLSKYYVNGRLRRMLGNTQLSDAWTYKGRGYVQITGRANYRKFGIEDAPEKALEPETALRIMNDGMRDGTFTGVKLEKYVSREHQLHMYREARMVINGLDQAARIAGYAIDFESILWGSQF